MYLKVIFLMVGIYNLGPFKLQVWDPVYMASCYCGTFSSSIFSATESSCQKKKKKSGWETINELENTKKRNKWMSNLNITKNFIPMTHENKNE